MQVKHKSTEPDSPWNILNALNEDCFLKIFTHLTLPDLSIAADVCIYFNQCAIEVFLSKYRDQSLSFHSEMSGRFDVARVMFRHFGALIQSLSICYTFEVIKEYGFSLRMINQNCSTLRELHLSSFRYRGDWRRLVPMFSRLHLLKLEKSDLSSSNRSLFTAGNLRVLHFIDCQWSDKFIGQQFQSIEEAYFRSNGINVSTFVRFITQNPTVRKLSFIGNRLTSTDLLRSIADHSINLREFEFDEIVHNLDQYQQNMLSLSQLQSLITLKLNLNSLPAGPLMQALVENESPIVHLSLSKGHIDADGIEILSQARLVEILELSEVEGVTNENIISLATKMTQLKELHLHRNTSNLTTNGLKTMLEHLQELKILALNSMDGIWIDTDDYYTILKTVQRRREYIQLSIDISSKESRIIIPDVILKPNEKWVRINEKILQNYFWDDSPEMSEHDDDE